MRNRLKVIGIALMLVLNGISMSAQGGPTGSGNSSNVRLGLSIRREETIALAQSLKRNVAFLLMPKTQIQQLSLNETGRWMKMALEGRTVEYVAPTEFTREGEKSILTATLERFECEHVAWNECALEWDFSSTSTMGSFGRPGERVEQGNVRMHVRILFSPQVRPEFSVNPVPSAVSFRSSAYTIQYNRGAFYLLPAGTKDCVTTSAGGGGTTDCFPYFDDEPRAARFAAALNHAARLCGALRKEVK